MLSLGGPTFKKNCYCEKKKKMKENDDVNLFNEHLAPKPLTFDNKIVNLHVKIQKIKSFNLFFQRLCFFLFSLCTLTLQKIVQRPTLIILLISFLQQKMPKTLIILLTLSSKTKGSQPFVPQFPLPYFLENFVTHKIEGITAPFSAVVYFNQPMGALHAVH